MQVKLQQVRNAGRNLILIVTTIKSFFFFYCNLMSFGDYSL